MIFLSTRRALGEVKWEMREMEANDFWTFVGLVIGAFAIVVAPRLFEPGHTATPGTLGVSGFLGCCRPRVLLVSWSLFRVYGRA